MNKKYLLFGSIFMTTGVILGAFGAHALKAHLDYTQLDIWKTAVFYQMIHALALIALAGYIDALTNNKSKIVFTLFVFGILLFSGSLYLLSAADLSLDMKSKIGPMTPVGGVCFVLGWIVLIYQCLKK